MKIQRKADYVRAARQTRNHECHWPGCQEQCKPAAWGCRRHWYMLPLSLRNRIWATFRPGQEATLTPSRQYVAVAREVQTWISENYPTSL